MHVMYINKPKRDTHINKEAYKFDSFVVYLCKIEFSFICNKKNKRLLYLKRKFCFSA